jgi:hypothetical protein
MELLQSAALLLMIPIRVAISILTGVLNISPGYYEVLKDRKKDRKKGTRFRVKVKLRKKKVKLSILIGKEFSISKASLVKLLITITLCLLSLAAR